MATLEWNSATTYPAASIVSYGGLLWEAIQVSTNETPARGSPYWGIVGIGSALGVSSVSGSGPGLAVTGVAAVTVQNTGVVDIVAGTRITVTDLSGVYTVTPTNAPTYTAGTGITFVGTTIDNNLAGLNTPNPATVSISADASSNYTVGFTSDSPYTGANGVSIASSVATNTGVVGVTGGTGVTAFASGPYQTFNFDYTLPSPLPWLQYSMDGFDTTNLTWVPLNQAVPTMGNATLLSGAGVLAAVTTTFSSQQTGVLPVTYPPRPTAIRAYGNVTGAIGGESVKSRCQFAQTVGGLHTGGDDAFSRINVLLCLQNGYHYNAYPGNPDTGITVEVFSNSDALSRWNTASAASIQFMGIF